MLLSCWHAVKDQILLQVHLVQFRPQTMLLGDTQAARDGSVDFGEGNPFKSCQFEPLEKMSSSRTSSQKMTKMEVGKTGPYSCEWSDIDSGGHTLLMASGEHPVSSNMLRPHLLLLNASTPSARSIAFEVDIYLFGLCPVQHSWINCRLTSSV